MLATDSRQSYVSPTWAHNDVAFQWLDRSMLATDSRQSYVSPTWARKHLAFQLLDRCMDTVDAEMHIQARRT